MTENTTPSFDISRREARDLLKAANKQAAGPDATLLCAIISHARGKIHCRTYKLYSGGWRTSARDMSVAQQRVTPKIQRSYGTYAARYLGRAEITSLVDQAEFIRWHLERAERKEAWNIKWAAKKGEKAPEQLVDAKIRYIARRIIGDAVEPATPAQAA
jgi:hypothetical protein